MRIEQMTVHAAIEEGKKLPFALIRTLSGMTFGKTPREIAPDLLEARFFDGAQEIRVFSCDGELAAVKKTGEESDIGKAQRFEVQNEKFGKAFTVFRLYAADEDGQSYIKDTRLTDWEGGTQNA